ncbi:hypothetical protein FrEUN1fDRAFT_8139, partial [Parafrankia sp. EUN1f]
MTQISGDDIESPNQEPARQVPDEAGALTDVDQPFSGDRWSL